MLKISKQKQKIICSNLSLPKSIFTKFICSKNKFRFLNKKFKAPITPQKCNGLQMLIKCKKIKISKMHINNNFFSKKRAKTIKNKNPNFVNVNYGKKTAKNCSFWLQNFYLRKCRAIHKKKLKRMFNNIYTSFNSKHNTKIQLYFLMFQHITLKKLIICHIKKDFNQLYPKTLKTFKYHKKKRISIKKIIKIVKIAWNIVNLFRKVYNLIMKLFFDL